MKDYTSKLKYNFREREVQENGIKNGWKVLYKGWPDFLFYKEINGKIEAFCVEVKRKMHKGSKTLYDDRPSPCQEEMFKILKQLGVEIKIVVKG